MEQAAGRARRRRPQRDAEPARIPFFGSKPFGGRSPDSPMLSKAEFVEKVRQSNQACHDGDFHTAIMLYNEALGVDPQNCILYSNRSAAYMKIQQYDKALDDAIKARLLNPKWPKLPRKHRLHLLSEFGGSGSRLLTTLPSSRRLMSQTRTLGILPFSLPLTTLGKRSSADV